MCAIRIIRISAVVGLLFFPVLWATEFALIVLIPCDEAIPAPIGNARGDVAMECVQICTGVGTAVNYSISLRLRSSRSDQKLIEYSEPHQGYPKFRWIDDDTLNIDLGQIRWMRQIADKVGSIRVAYSYTYANVE